jgi:hypothetical protein
MARKESQDIRNVPPKDSETIFDKVNKLVNPTNLDNDKKSGL